MSFINQLCTLGVPKKKWSYMNFSLQNKPSKQTDPYIGVMKHRFKNNN